MNGGNAGKRDPNGGEADGQALRAYRGTPALYSIAPDRAFLPTLAARLWWEAGGDPMALAAMTVLVPNRRAVLGLREAFLQQAGGRPALLPHMVPIGDLPAGEAGAGPLAGLARNPDAARVLADLPPAMPDVRRRALLTRQIMHASPLHGAGDRPSAAGSWRLAGELARLMDDVDSAGLDFDGLRDLVPENLAGHWDITLQFLRIVAETWPRILAAQGMMNPAARRDRLIRLVADVWAETPPDGPVIAAGSTGTLKSTAELLGVVARLPKGRVVLPGFDPRMSDAAWDALEPTHPHYVMARLMDRIAARRQDVRPLPEPEDGPPSQPAPRPALLREALAPASVTDAWQDAPYRSAPTETLFAGVEKLVAANPREEAEAIALAMREALETPGRTAALVTPDRLLARLTRLALERYDITVDDSGGEPVAASLPGRLLGLIAEAVGSGFAPVPVLALLQHPLVAFGEDRGRFHAFVRRLDRLVLRGPRPEAGLDGILARARQPDRRGQPALGAGDQDRIARLRDVFFPLVEALPDDGGPVAPALAAHVRVAEALAATDGETGAERLWRHEAGETLAALMADLMSETADMGTVDRAGYPALVDAMLADGVVRPVWKRHPRLFIWGTLEARLQRADLMILGGLNEGTWPMDDTTDPWMNRQMRADFGLPPLDRGVGQAAHDFLTACAQGQVLLTRSEKVDGSPTVASRWLFRIEALAGRALPQARRYAAWAAAQDRPDAVRPVAPPRPTPPVAARPATLSVTQVQTLMKDPYALYADKILGLRPLDGLDEPPNPARRGTMLHDALERFLKEDGPVFGQPGLDRLLAIGEEAFRPVLTQPTVYAFWWPRFRRVAEWFVENEAARRAAIETALIEGWAERDIPGTDVRLKAKADRIDRIRETGELIVIDYKTGGSATRREMEAGYAPQLPLEGWLAEQGAFTDLPAAPVAHLIYWELKGGRTVQSEKEPVKDPGDLIARSAEGLVRLVRRFMIAETPYLSNPRPHMKGYGDYDLLARVLEWQTLIDEEGGDDPCP
ncbi:double-strand break repair protein AddB [Yunchengibacter salinarum]|uniref:double-strand break repair protein AddB n=1 Tax=Yunchengibacter salinarum TaxID=3133399 RepID=UPI0035B5E2A8